MEHKPQAPVEGSASVPVAPAVSRRALLRGGAAATPVLLTLGSAPVSAATNACTVASSFVSVATFNSRNPSKTAQCGSRTCEDWRYDATNISANKAYLDLTTVAALLGTTSPTSTLANASLSSVLGDPGGIVKNNEIGVLQHLISLCLNVKFGNAPQPGNVTQSYLSAVWKNYKLNGGRYVLSSSGINWDSSQLVTWVRMLVYGTP